MANQSFPDRKPAGSPDFTRRSFISKLGIILLPLSTLNAHAESAAGLSFVGLRDGDILHEGDGLLSKGKLSVKVNIAASDTSRIVINGKRTRLSDGLHTATIQLTDYENNIVAADLKTGEKQTIKVFRAPNLLNKYRLSIDDAIWFLRDLNENAATYHSLFDTPFLGFLKTLHDTHGTKTHINIFYETDNFNLSQMTDKYKPEWKQNSDWLRLSFHAWAEFPDNPYINASYEKVRHDCQAVRDQIERFAGKEVMGPVTTLHWGEVPVEVSRALRDCGYPGQLCDFNVDNKLAPCSYYLTVDQRRHMNKRFVWRDNQEAISFIRSSIIIDTVKEENILPFLNRYEKESRRPPYVDLLIHEQYFYPYYKGYQANYRQKVETSVKWARENGYVPAFLDECLFG